MPAFELYEEGSTATTGTAINGGNPIEFGEVHKGMPSDVITVDLWNGRNDPLESLSATPRLYAVPGPDVPTEIFNGTTYNGFQSMLEARSCRGFGVAGDEDEEWSPISPSDFLEMGAMPGNTMRTIELRLNVPLDADTVAIKTFALHVSG